MGNWHTLHCAGRITCIVTLPWIELVSSSARVTSVKSAQPLGLIHSLTSGPIDRTPGLWFAVYGRILSICFSHPPQKVLKMIFKPSFSYDRSSFKDIVKVSSSFPQLQHKMVIVYFWPGFLWRLSGMEWWKQQRIICQQLLAETLQLHSLPQLKFKSLQVTIIRAEDYVIKEVEGATAQFSGSLNYHCHLQLQLQE